MLFVEALSSRFFDVGSRYLKRVQLAQSNAIMSVEEWKQLSFSIKKGRRTDESRKIRVAKQRKPRFIMNVTEIISLKGINCCFWRRQLKFDQFLLSTYFRGKECN